MGNAGIMILSKEDNMKIQERFKGLLQIQDYSFVGHQMMQ